MFEIWGNYGTSLVGTGYLLSSNMTYVLGQCPQTFLLKALVRLRSKSLTVYFLFIIDFNSNSDSLRYLTIKVKNTLNFVQKLESIEIFEKVSITFISVIWHGLRKLGVFFTVRGWLILQTCSPTTSGAFSSSRPAPGRYHATESSSGFQILLEFLNFFPFPIKSVPGYLLSVQVMPVLSSSRFRQCFGSGFIESGSGSIILGWRPIRIQCFDDQKFKKIYSWKCCNIYSFDQKLQFTYP